MSSILVPGQTSLSEFIQKRFVLNFIFVYTFFPCVCFCGTVGVDICAVFLNIIKQVIYSSSSITDHSQKIIHMTGQSFLHVMVQFGVMPHIYAEAVAYEPTDNYCLADTCIQPIFLIMY